MHRASVQGSEGDGWSQVGASKANHLCVVPELPLLHAFLLGEFQTGLLIYTAYAVVQFTQLLCRLCTQLFVYIQWPLEEGLLQAALVECCLHGLLFTICVETVHGW